MEDLLKNLNKEQIEAVKHTIGPLLIVAGAGTGKTTVITRRIVYLIEQKLAKPDEILAVTFTEKAAAEMQERVDLLLPLGYYDTWISTFHSFCERILKNHGLDIGLSNDFTLLDEIQQWILIYNNFEKFNLDYYRPLGSPDRFIDALIAHFSRCKDELITPEDYLEFARSLRLQSDQPNKIKKNQEPKIKKQNNTDIDETEIARLEEVANAFHTYQKLLLDNNYLDFGDLINYTLELFNKRQPILKYYQQKFKFIMVDEFQDTNYAQYRLVKLLAGDDKNLVVVGDDDQSIYKFRGASVSNILKFKEDYPNLKQITLIQNYRSTQNILDLAYKFIQANNPDRLEIKLNINKQLKSILPQAGFIEVLEGSDLSSELDLVAKKISELKLLAKKSWNDFAILIRANSAANELLPVLSNHGIPFTFVANRGLYKKPIIVDVLAYLNILNNVHDSQNLYRVLTLPKFYVSHQELSFLLHYAQKKTSSFFESLQQVQLMTEISSESKNKISELLNFLKKHSQETKNRTAAEMLVQILKDLEIEKKLEEDTLENAENRELLEQFYKKIESFEQQNSDKSLHNFLKTLELEMQAGSDGIIKLDPNLGPESLKVMTIHSAKGLEFEYVFIINLVDQRFPTRERGEPVEIPEKLIKDILPAGDFHLQEERRLFYVGATRAKTRLFLSWAKDYGGLRSKKPSQFLIETDLVPSEKISQATGQVVFTKPAKLKIVYQNLPNQFSYSQLIDFQNCPLKYKYQHYLKLPVPGTGNLSFGQTIHKVLEEFLKLYKTNLEMSQLELFGKTGSKALKLPDFEILEKLYQKFWIDDWYESKTEKEKYRKEGQNILKTFYEFQKQHNPKPKYIEEYFKLPLDKYSFVGKIDRGDEKDGGIEIIDYKTGKVPKSKNDIDQLYVYQWAAREYLNEKVIGLKYWYLQENDFFMEPPADPKQISTLKARLLEMIDKIIYTTKYNLFRQEHSKIKDHRCEFGALE